MLCRTLGNVSQQLHQWSGSLSWDVKNSLTDTHWDIQFRGLQRAFVHKSHFYAASSQECLDIWALWIPKWRSHPDLDIFQVHGILFSWLAEISVKRSGCWEFVRINLLLSCFSFFTLNSIALPWGSPSRAGGDKKLQMTGGGKEGAPPHQHSVQCKVHIKKLKLEWLVAEKKGPHHTTTVYNVKFISYIFCAHHCSIKLQSYDCFRKKDAQYC